MTKEDSMHLEEYSQVLFKLDKRLELWDQTMLQEVKMILTLNQSKELFS